MGCGAAAARPCPVAKCPQAVEVCGLGVVRPPNACATHRITRWTHRLTSLHLVARSRIASSSAPPDSIRRHRRACRRLPRSTAEFRLNAQPRRLQVAAQPAQSVRRKTGASGPFCLRGYGGSRGNGFDPSAGRSV